MARVKYEPMLVSYVDILGFGELINTKTAGGDFQGFSESSTKRQLYTNSKIVARFLICRMKIK